MKLLTFLKENQSLLGIKTEQGIVSVEEALQASAVENKNLVPTSVMEVIERGQEGIEALQNFLEQLSLSGNESYLLDESSLVFGPSVTDPSKIICVGLNYKKHADETNAPYPEVPILFNKFNNTLTGHNHKIAVPKVT